jgi:hypothetical protein
MVRAMAEVGTGAGAGAEIFNKPKQEQELVPLKNRLAPKLFEADLENLQRKKTFDQVRI